MLEEIEREFKGILISNAIERNVKKTYLKIVSIYVYLQLLQAILNN